MSLSVDMYMIVGREWLKNHYIKSFEQFPSCCGSCWCCVQMKVILDEFEKKGYEIFHSHVKGWKVYNFLNNFEVVPVLKRLILRNLFVSTDIFILARRTKKKMALSKETVLKFNKQTFRELSAPNNVLNLWIYNYFEKHKPCFTCETYSRYCKEVLREVWCADWEDIDFVLGKIKNCNKSFSNLTNYSDSNKWGILDELIKKIVNNCKKSVSKKKKIF